MSRPANQMQSQLQTSGQSTEQYLKTFFTYNLLFASVASAATASASLQIQASSDFLIQALSFTCFDLTTHGAITAPQCTIQLTDTGSSATLFDQPIPITNVFGTGQFPFVLPVPKLMVANSSLTGSLVATYLANASYFVLSFHGRKIFKG